MIIVCCEKCGGYTPEGFALCPACMRESGADEREVQAVSDLLEVVSVLNMGDTDASRKSAIESILNIKNRLERNSDEEKTETQAQE